VPNTLVLVLKIGQGPLNTKNAKGAAFQSEKWSRASKKFTTLSGRDKKFPRRRALF
jgi:hypothetical protein